MENLNHNNDNRPRVSRMMFPFSKVPVMNTCEYDYVSYPYSVTRQRGGPTREAKISWAAGRAVASARPLGGQGAQLKIREGAAGSAY